MATPTETIRAGLDKHEKARKSLPVPRLAHLIGKRTDLKSLQVLRNDISKSLTRIRKLRGDTVSAIEKRTAEIRAHYDAEGYVEGDREGMRQDILTAPRRKVLTDRALMKMKKKVAANVASEIDVLLRKVNAAKEDVASVRAAWRDPISVLMRVTLDSADREKYMANMANAGPEELLVYAHEAVHENNKAKGAAVLARTDRLPGETKKSLRFTKNDIAEALIYQEFNAAIEAMELSEFSILMAFQESREALGMTLNAGDVTAVGLKRAEVEHEIGREITMADFEVTEVTGEPAKKPAKKPDDYSGDNVQFLKDDARFRALFGQETRTPEEYEELKALITKLDIGAE